MLLIDHNMALIMDVCDRIHVLDRGTTLAAGTPAEIRENLDVASAYLGESAIAEEARVTPLLELAGLSVPYGGVPALRALDLQIEPRRDRRADRAERRRQVDDAARDHGHGAVARGEIRLAGASLRGRAPEKVARAGIALVPEGRRVFAELTVEENLRLGPRRASRAGRRGRGHRGRLRALPDRARVPPPARPARSRAASSSSS